MSQHDVQRTRGYAQRPPEQTPYHTEEGEYADDAIYSTRLPTSARRYTFPVQQGVTTKNPRKRVVNVYDLSANIPPRRSRMETQEYAAPALPQARPTYRRLRSHWMLLVGIGMLVMITLWMLGTMLVNWWSVTQADWQYGRPRTFQIDAVVGHGDSPGTPSHFVAINLNRHVIIIEMPGGEPSKARIYSGPTLFGDGQDLTPVTLTFRDVNGDGKLDMIVRIQDQTLVYINDGTQFRPLKPGEHVIL